MHHEVELNTQRLILKSITPAFLQELFRTQDKVYIMQYLGLDEGGYQHYREMHEKGMESFRISILVFLLIDQQTQLPIGECGFHTWNQKHRRAEVFYHLKHDSDKRKGFMTEALHAVLDYGFNAMNLHRIQALVDPGNTPSIKLLQRYGFSKEGTHRQDYNIDGSNYDSDCYSLLKWEWKG